MRSPRECSFLAVLSRASCTIVIICHDRRMPDQTLTSLAQLSLSAATAVVAFSVYRVQADKLFLEFRDKRALALEAYSEAVRSRLEVISALTIGDVTGFINAAKLDDGMREVSRTSSTLRSWFGAEVGVTIQNCEVALIDAFNRKFEWCAAIPPSPALFNKVSDAILDAYSAAQRVADAAVPYLYVERRGLTLSQRTRGIWQHFKS